MVGLLDPVQSAMDFRRDATFSEWADVLRRVGVSAKEDGASKPKSESPLDAGSGAAKGLGDDTGTSSLGFMEGMATFGANALGIAGFGVPSAIGLGLGIAQNSTSLSALSAIRDAMDDTSASVSSTDGGDPTGDPDGSSASGTDSDPGGHGPGGSSGVSGNGPDADAGGDSNGDGPGGSADGGGDGDGDGGGDGGGDGFRYGGLVLTHGDGDDDAGSVRVSNGEYILPADVVRRWLPLFEEIRQTGRVPSNPEQFQVNDENHFRRLSMALAQRNSSPAAQETTRGKGLLSR